MFQYRKSFFLYCNIYEKVSFQYLYNPVILKPMAMTFIDLEFLYSDERTPSCDHGILNFLFWLLGLVNNFKHFAGSSIIR